MFFNKKVDGILLKNDMGGITTLEIDESQLNGISQTIIKKSFDNC